MMTRAQIRADIGKLFRQVRIRGRELKRIFSLVLLTTIAWELNGIWIELKGIRDEQVKNALYALAPKQIERLRSRSHNGAVNSRLRRLESEVVGIEQSVDVNIQEPLTVDIGNQPLSVDVDSNR